MTYQVFRDSRYSEFSIHAPTAISARMQAQKLAKSLLKNAGLAQKILPQHRLPTFGEYRLLVNAVQRKQRSTATAMMTPREAYNTQVFKSLRDLQGFHLYRNLINRARATIQMPFSAKKEHRSVLDLRTLTRELGVKQGILRENLLMLRRLNAIQRMNGEVNSFNRTYDARKPQLRSKQIVAKRIKDENKHLGCRLEQAKSKVDCHNERFVRPPPAEQKLRMSIEVFNKFNRYLPEPSAIGRRRRTPNEILRPIIFFDLCVGKAQFLGRITIQLYTEVSPEVVLEFVRLATDNDVQAHKFLHIFPDLWMEGVVVPQRRDALDNHHNGESLIDARKVKGVLSYSNDYCKQFPQGLLHYSISFKKLAVYPLQRVIFGHVISGMRLLDVCREFGTRCGSCKNNVRVVKSGLP